MFLLNFVTWKYSFFKQKGYLDMLPVFPDKPSFRFFVNFLVKIPSIALVLPPLTVLITLANLLDEFMKIFYFFTLLFLNFQQ